MGTPPGRSPIGYVPSVAEAGDRQTVPPGIFGDERDSVALRATAAGLQCQVSDNTERRLLFLDLPNGREARTVLVTPTGAKGLLAEEFESHVVLGPYDALLSRSKRTIEACVASVDPFGLDRLARLPQVEWEPERQLHLFNQDEAPGNDPQSGTRRRTEWRLTIGSTSDPAWIEISSPSESMDVLRSVGRRGVRRNTLKIPCRDSISHDNAVSLLESVTSALFFELDLTHSISLTLLRSPPRLRAGNPVQVTDEPERSALRLPTKKYPNDAVSLYAYARSATSMPLLQFLGYYQCIEYFFPQYWNNELLSRLRRTLSDPRFNTDNDRDLGRLLQVVSSGSRGGGGPEREQLRTTIEACIDQSELRSLLEDELDGYLAGLSDKNRLRGVRALAIRDRNHPLSHQVADRIYDLRCRVVHSKDDAASAYPEVLLPFSREADRLGPDIALIRAIAQKVIIAGRRGELW
jgi:hypothetical protein